MIYLDIKGGLVMPYYITKEIINKAVLNIFNDVNLDNRIIGQIGEDLNNETFTTTDDTNMCDVLSKVSLNDSGLYNVSDMLFQLRDYRFYLGYIVRLLLNSRHYDEIAKFFSHMFVNHIGDVSYVSKDYNYEYNERYFDRFVESVKYCQIDNFKIMPFLFYIYNSDSNAPCHKFLRPALEFLKGVITNNEASYLNYINDEKLYKTGYRIYLDVFDSKGAQRLIDNLINENYFSKDDLVELFLYKKDVCLNELREYILRQVGEKQIVALKFYLCFSQDVKSTLPKLYEKLTDENVKALLKDEIELSKTTKFETIKDFVDYVELNNDIETIDGISTKYLIYFKNNQRVGDKVLTYILNMFKNISSPIVVTKYRYLKDFFTDAELDNLGTRLLFGMNNTITEDNKWIVAYVCAMCSQDTISNLVDMTPTCLGNTELSSFVLGCLVETNNAKVISLIKQLYMESNNKQVYYNYLELLAHNNSMTALDYLDEMVSNYGLDDNCTRQIVCNGETLVFEITDNLSVKVRNLNTYQYVNLSNPQFVDTANAIDYYNNLTMEIRNQIDKFNNAYLTRRTWTIATFIANILSNPILKKISTTLTWGAYEKDSLIKIYDSSLDVMQETNQDVKIALVHPVELQKPIFKSFEPFRQLNKCVFVANNSNYSNKCSNEFNGIMVNDISFNTRLRVRGYKMSANNDSYYYKRFDKDNLLVKVELIKTSSRSTSIIGNIKFYNLNLVETTNHKYNLVDTQPEDIGSVNKRIYSDVLNDVYEACY